MAALKVGMTSYEKGQLEGQRNLLRKQLENKFGPLPPEALSRLASWTQERLEEVGLSYTNVQSLRELGLAD